MNKNDLIVSSAYETSQFTVRTALLECVSFQCIIVNIYMTKN